METKNLTTIREWKMARGLTAPEVAQLFGITREYLFYLMRGNTPGKNLARKIHEITGIPLLNLLYFGQAGGKDAAGSKS